MSAPPVSTHDADLALAARDEALPCLAHLLDDDILSELVGEPLHITRVRYKPRTSVLVAFRRSGTGRAGTADPRTAEDGTAGYGWALSTKNNVKLNGRARSAARRGGPGVQLIRPLMPHLDAAIAVGVIEDDWLLRHNLRWLAEYGLEMLGVDDGPDGRDSAGPSQAFGAGQSGNTSRVLRYKPERRLVLLKHARGTSIVIKTAALASDHAAQELFQRQLEEQGIPVLPRLADASCSDHGISASPVWGKCDLSTTGDAESAHRAGAALARLHRLPADAAPGPVTTPEALVTRQIDATCAMVAELQPTLAGRAANLAGRLRRRLDETTDGRTPVLIHGDFSADQVRVDGAEVRLLDFDRVRPGAPESDLGSFAAVEEAGLWHPGTDADHRAHTGALFEGYAEAGGRFSPAAVDAWAAYRLFCNSVDPFRDRAEDWAAEMSRHIELASGRIP
ncbi:phosphotransferase family protein [Arthrobacter sp. 2MCAF15]|uniref:phosphotransferase family protein n=1 Tax=Arthrobacter sp. 2MCAF15 TaxID=3232984 RepID=UPI003F92ED26